MEKVDYLRGLIPRSKWISVALESIIETTENKMPLSFQVSRPRKTEAIRSLNESIQTQEPVIDYE
jgi:hypothetical protein